MIMERLRQLNTDSWSNARTRILSSVTVAALLLVFVLPMTPAADDTTSYAPQLPDELVGELPEIPEQEEPPPRPEGEPRSWGREVSMEYLKKFNAYREASTFPAYREAWQTYLEANNIEINRPSMSEILAAHPAPEPPDGEPASWSESRAQEFISRMTRYAKSLQSKYADAEEAYDRDMQNAIDENESTPGREIHAEICRRILDPIQLNMIESPTPPPPAESSGPPYEFWLVEVKPIILKRVDPNYPELPMSAGMEGDVFVEMVVDETGFVAESRVLRGAPIFHDPAIEATRGMRFTPALKDGIAVPVKVAKYTQRSVEDYSAEDM